MQRLSTPNITKWVHLSIIGTSSSGVSGIGIRHTVHIAAMSNIDTGYCLILCMIKAVLCAKVINFLYEARKTFGLLV